MSPVGILLCVVTTEAQVKVFTDVAVDPAAYNEPLAVVAGVFHVHHLMVVLVALRLCTTWLKIHTFRFTTLVSLNSGLTSCVTVCVVVVVVVV